MMIVLNVIGVLIIAIWMCSIGPFLCKISTEGVNSLEEFFNLVDMYRYGEVNVFGAGLLTIICTICFFPMAVVYWIYKLCTVGRG